MKISKNFISEEFLSKDFHDFVISRGYDPRWFLDSDILGFCVWLRAKCNGASLTINDWKWGGSYNYSGFREPACDIGAVFSQHRFKNAVDIKVDGYTPSVLRQIVVDNFTYINKVYKISTIEKIELTPTWFHVDKRWTGKNYLIEV